jgi:SAM-dependent methyltransferase
VELKSSYDAIAAAYAERYAGELAHKPLDRALLSAFAAVLGPGAPVLDAGCGPGHVTAFLGSLGLGARGLDLSAGMVAEARRLHPSLGFDVGSMLDLPVTNGALAGVVAFYSVIHLHDDELRRALAEFRRVLRPGGLVLVAVHVGDDVRHADEMLGTAVDLDFHFHRTEALSAALEAAGLRVDAVLERRAYVPHEVDTRRGYVLAARPLD